MLEVRWVPNQANTRSHAFASSSPSSLCNQAILPPVEPDATPSTNPIGMRPSSIPRCGTCSRLFATMEKQAEASDDAMLVDAYLEQATQLVVGQGWTYAELGEMPSWKETVDRVATALANERRAALAQVRPVPGPRAVGRYTEEA
jgi:hypothetical protein